MKRKENWPPKFWKDPVLWWKWKDQCGDSLYYWALIIAHVLCFGYMVASVKFGWYKE